MPSSWGQHYPVSHRSSIKQRRVRKRLAPDRRCYQKCTKKIQEVWNEFSSQTMNSTSLVITTLLNAECYAQTLIDTDCLSYRVIDEKFVAKNHLQRMKIKSQSIAGYDSSWSSYIKKVAVVWMNIDEYCREQTFFYIVSHIEGYDLLLELLWVKAEQVSISAEREWITIKQLGRKTPNQCTESNDKSDSLISATAYLTLIQRLLYRQALITRASTSFVTLSSYSYLVSVNCRAWGI